MTADQKMALAGMITILVIVCVCVFAAADLGYQAWRKRRGRKH